jgi:uncharacterized protein YcfL
MKRSLYLLPLLFILTGCSTTTTQPVLPEQKEIEISDKTPYTT